MAKSIATQEFLDRLAARDFEHLAATLASDAQARFLLPGGYEEQVGADAIVRRFQSWFGPASQCDLVASNGEAVGPRDRLSWRFDVVRNGSSHEMVEQVAYFDVGPDGIEWIDLVCSGFQAAPHVGLAADQIFDAGAMGCADGLAQEFRRRLEDVPVGGSLRVVVRDPAAKEDLPSLARLLGQRVASTEAQDDGRLSITVERRK
jgi:tRNA 2-thiouridine synthesizing protein A/cysteine desulfurase